MLAAVAVGLSNLAAAIGIGVTGVNARVRLQVGLELGGLLGRWAGARSEQMSGLILILVGAAIAGGALG